MPLCLVLPADLCFLRSSSSKTTPLLRTADMGDLIAILYDLRERIRLDGYGLSSASARLLPRSAFLNLDVSP